jgi:hypothetical protein
VQVQVVVVMGGGGVLLFPEGNCLLYVNRVVYRGI